MTITLILFIVSVLGLIVLLYVKSLNKVILRDHSHDNLTYNPNWFTIDYGALNKFISKKSGDFFARWAHKLLVTVSKFIINLAVSIAERSRKLADKVEERIKKHKN